MFSARPCKYVITVNINTLNLSSGLKKYILKFVCHSRYFSKTKLIKPIQFSTKKHQVNNHFQSSYKIEVTKKVSRKQIFVIFFRSEQKNRPLVICYYSADGKFRPIFFDFVFERKYN